jgi:hypothetical protein
MPGGFISKKKKNMFDPGPQTYDVFNDRAVFEYRSSYIPRRCYNSNRWIWGTAVRGRRTITGPGTPVIQDRWYHRHEAIIMMLKGI